MMREINGIRHELKILKELTDHSRTMSIGSKTLINTIIKRIDDRLFLLEAEVSDLRHDHDREG